MERQAGRGPAEEEISDGKMQEVPAVAVVRRRVSDLQYAERGAVRGQQVECLIFYQRGQEAQGCNFLRHGNVYKSPLNLTLDFSFRMGYTVI